MLEYQERIRRRVYLFAAVLVLLFAAYRVYKHDRHTVKASKEMRQGMKVFTDPEALAKDVE